MEISTPDATPPALGSEEFAQIRKDLTTPSLLATLRDDSAIRSKMTEAEMAVYDTILKEVGTPEEYPLLAEYIMRALPYIRLTYSGKAVPEPIAPTPSTLALLMKGRFI